MSQIDSHSESHVSRLKSVAGSALSISLRASKHLWIGPAFTAVLIAIVGWWTHSSVESAVKTNLASHLQALLDADVAAMDLWLAEKKSDVRALAGDDRLRGPAAELASLATQASPDTLTAELLSSNALKELRTHLEPRMNAHQFNGFVLINPEYLVLASDLDIGIGDASLARLFASQLEPVFNGETTLLPPFKSMLVRPDADGTPRAGMPIMIVVAPVRDSEGSLVAALGMRILPDQEFTEILRVARVGETGETYAFNKDGVLITNSRFDDQLKHCGLLVDDEKTHSLLNIEIRDPGVDMTQGERPANRRSEQPFTTMATSALAGESGVNVDGYRDYRGVPVVGAWTWLPEHEIGVASEMDAVEAFGPLNMLRRAFGVLTALLVAVTLGLCGLTYYAARLDLQARRSALEAKRLGQYSLIEKIGAGGMGVVYRAHHDMLHRPTAVKLLLDEKTNESTIARFEREVQLTSQLTHPNTIAIYDFGRTPEGIFYYAMEYLDGIALEDFVAKFGPQPSGRVIYLLRQLCDSLSEAHQKGLIHRDIKPANVMLTRQGGLCDFVKLLDFGLVKPQNADQNMTLAGSLTGTPLYLSPEAILHKELDSRSDLYAVGAVGYFLLTGETPFEGDSIIDICNAHIHSSPVSPSERLSRPVDPDLENLVLSCLAKNREDRPQSAESLEKSLSQCQSAPNWTRSHAKNWWAIHIDSSDNPEQTAAGADLPDVTVVIPPNGKQ